MCLLSNVCAISLVLVAAHSLALSLPLQIESQSAEKSIALEKDYLAHLYKTIKDSGRQPNSEGELNLLPDDTESFANIVQGLTEDQPTVTTSTSYRELSFNIKYIFMTSTQELVAFHLVIPTEGFQTQFTINTYEPGNLQEPTSTGSTGQKYIDLHLGMLSKPNLYPEEVDTLYNLVIEVTDISNNTLLPEDILSQLKPILVVYSHDTNMLQNIFRAPPGPESRAKRQASDETNVEITNQQKSSDFCKVKSVNLTTYYWLDDNLEALSPEFPTVSFCDGHCRIDGNLEHGKYISKHGKLVGDMDPRLIEPGIARCCIPKTYSNSPLEYRRKGHHIVILGEIPQVTECYCY